MNIELYKLSINHVQTPTFHKYPKQWYTDWTLLRMRSKQDENSKKKNKGQKIKHIDMPKPNHVSNENPNIFKILMDDKDKGPN